MKQSNFLLCLPVVISVLLTACNGTRDLEQRMSPPIPVVAYQVTSGSTTYFDEYPASVIALNQVDIRPEVSGYITGNLF